MKADKTVGVSVLVSLAAANDLLTLSIREVLAKKGAELSPFDERDYWYREIVYCVEGTIGDPDECPECEADVSDRWHGWEYCPFCGSELGEEEAYCAEYKTEAAAKRDEHYEDYGITEMMRFGVRKRPENPDDAIEGMR